MFISGYNLNNYQQTQITGSLCTKLLLLVKLLFKWWLLMEAFCFGDFMNEVFSYCLRRCQFQTHPPSPYHSLLVPACHQGRPG